MEEGEKRERWKRERWKREGEGEMDGLVVTHVCSWCWPLFMHIRVCPLFIRGRSSSWRSSWGVVAINGGRVVLHGCSMFVGGSWSSMGTQCSWVVCRGRQWRVIRECSGLVGECRLWVLNACGWEGLSSIGVSAVWCRICGQSRLSVGVVSIHL